MPIFSQAIGDEDGFAIQWQGANFVEYFGPFATLEEAQKWTTDNKLPGLIFPLFKTVDWERHLKVRERERLARHGR